MPLLVVGTANNSCTVSLMRAPGFGSTPLEGTLAIARVHKRQSAPHGSVLPDFGAALAPVE